MELPDYEVEVALQAYMQPPLAGVMPACRVSSAAIGARGRAAVAGIYFVHNLQGTFPVFVI